MQMGVDALEGHSYGSLGGFDIGPTGQQALELAKTASGQYDASRTAVDALPLSNIIKHRL